MKINLPILGRVRYLVIETDLRSFCILVQVWFQTELAIRLPASFQNWRNHIIEKGVLAVRVGKDCSDSSELGIFMVILLRRLQNRNRFRRTSAVHQRCHHLRVGWFDSLLFPLHTVFLV